MAKKTCNILLVILLAFAVDVCAADFRSVSDTIIPKTQTQADTIKQETQAQKSTAKPEKKKKTVSRTSKRVTFESFDQYYARALKYYNNRQWLSAAGLFEELYPLSLGTPRADTILFLFAHSYYMNGDYQALIRLSESMIPPGSAYLLNAAISVVLYIFGAGFLIFIFNTIKRSGAVYGNLLDGFGLAGKLILLALLQGLFIFLWSLLLVIPGIIAAYRYRMAKFLLLDDPSRGVTDCIRASKQMMYGHKWECFVLDLSFIGWWLLTAIPYVGYAVMVWTTPYINTTYVLYYMALAGKPVIVGPAPSEPTYM